MAERQGYDFNSINPIFLSCLLSTCGTFSSMVQDVLHMELFNFRLADHIQAMWLRGSGLRLTGVYCRKRQLNLADFNLVS